MINNQLSRKELTLCAPATPVGGAVSLIRISGPESIAICRKIFFPSDISLDISSINGFRIVHGIVRDEGRIIDEVLLSIFRSPNSYTGEDSAEITCHGSGYIVSKIMELLISNGAKTAMPGEFTQRAFMNGKMDLSQAEAVADLVASRSFASHKIAINQLRGGFSSEIAALRKELLHFASLIELELDFGEEEVEFADRDQLQAIINNVKQATDRLAGSFKLGNAIRTGIPVAIVGKPNSGKSTLLNALLNEEKAIVSDIPGTTRDSIEDTIVVNGLEFRFIDTAGLRDTSDVIESMGIRKTHEKISQAYVVLLVDDIDDTPETINIRISSVRSLIEGHDKKLIILINKTDKGSVVDQNFLSSKIGLGSEELLLFISAKEAKGLDELKAVLSEVAGSSTNEEGVIISNLRHFEALNNASLSLSRILKGIIDGIPSDLVAVDIRQAIHYLGEITGEITTDEILGNIFRNFCIGK